MSYQSMFSFAFQNLSGLTLNAKLFDSAGAQTGATITSGFADLGDGAYQYLATIPDGHVGTLKIYDSAQPSRCIPLAVNPQEIENANVRISDLNNLSISNVEFALSDYGVAVTGDLSDFIGTGGANLTAIGDTRLDNLNATITSRLAIADYIAPDNATITAIAGYVDTEVAAIKAKTDNLPASPASSGNVTSAQTAITDAISALNDIAAADVVTAIMAYAVESGKDYATVLKEVYAILRGKYIADNADPTSVTYYAPDGTTARVTFTLDDTTRTPS